MPLSLISIIYLFLGENILVWINRYFNFTTDLEFINNLNNVFYNFSLSIISGLIIYFFTGYIPEKKRNEKFNVAYFRVIYDLYSEIKSLNDYYENYILCIKEDKENFENLNIKVLFPEPCITDRDWKARFNINKKHSEVNMQSQINLIEDRINEINTMNLLIFNDCKMQGFISDFKKGKSISEKYKSPNTMEIYYKDIINRINVIYKIYSYEYINKKCKFKM